MGLGDESNIDHVGRSVNIYELASSEIGTWGWYRLIE